MSRALARPEYWNVSRQTYSVQNGAPLDAAKCTVCHMPSGPPARNSYGITIERGLQAAHTTTLTPAILHPERGSFRRRNRACLQY